MFGINSHNRWVRAFFAWSVAGTVLMSTCSSSQIQAIVTGVEIIASALAEDDRSDNNNISFGDWLFSELTD